MNRCENCDVDLFDSEKKCPLCGEKFSGTGDSVIKYPEYKEIVSKRSPLWNVPMFVLFATTLICFYINFFTYDDGDVIWSAIVVAALLYINGVIGAVKSHTNRFASKVLINYVLLSVFVIVLDIILGMRFWSTNYVFPFLTILTTLFITVLALRSKSLFSEYFGYIITVTILSITPIPIYVFGLSNQPWGVFIAIMICAIIALGLYLFSHKTFKQEIKKRFHR